MPCQAKRKFLSFKAQKKLHSLEASQFIEFLAYSGVRIDEARHITGYHIEESRIRIAGGATGTKNHESRYVPIIPAMSGLIKRINPESGRPLFALKSPREALTNACKRLNIPHVRIHDLRHFFATTCIESGIDFATVGKWLGHKDGGILAARTYGHIRDDHSQTDNGAGVVFYSPPVG
ncbi:tyrosine-type recombinase/integrase [uncultured Desulfobacter sp.]|uniref:tyrosine-type recombinase/integrase n=1 Tax=uncultured Desulfobacter sp. TaxID=240139 RepID=UPI003747ACD0